MKIIKKPPLGLSQRVFIVIVIASVIFIPLIPLGIKSAWIYTGKPEFCVSCHTMSTQYSNWSHSAHRNWAGCADCHLPTDSILKKSVQKIRDGIYHGYAYVLNKDSTLVRISKLGGKSVINNCVRCHGELVSGIHKGDRLCWDCHSGVAHGY